MAKSVISVSVALKRSHLGHIFATIGGLVEVDGGGIPKTVLGFFFGGGWPRPPEDGERVGTRWGGFTGQGGTFGPAAHQGGPPRRRWRGRVLQRGGARPDELGREPFTKVGRLCSTSSRPQTRGTAFPAVGLSGWGPEGPPGPGTGLHRRVERREMERRKKRKHVPHRADIGTPSPSAVEQSSWGRNWGRPSPG